mgnify:CR=1 FL=1
MTSRNDASAIEIFAQGHVTAAGGVGRSWSAEDFYFSDAACTLASERVFFIPPIRHPALGATWRGRRILSEEDLTNTDCPFPPEREWEDR